MEPLVSVICITRNHERFCIESLDSVLNQTYKNIELIILDAASTDGTVELIDNWLVENKVQAVFLKEKELKPITVNLNKALTYAHGEYVQFLSLDDVLFEEKIAKNIETFLKLPNDYCAIYSDMMIIDAYGKKVNPSYLSTRISVSNNRPSGRIYSELIIYNFLPAPAIMYKFQSILDIGCFDENLNMEDYDLLIRLSKEGSIHYLDNVYVKYRQHDNNLGSIFKRREKNMTWSMAQTFYKQIKANDSSPEDLKVIRMNFLKEYLQMIKNRDARINKYFITVFINLDFNIKIAAIILIIFQFRFDILTNYVQRKIKQSSEFKN